MTDAQPPTNLEDNIDSSVPGWPEILPMLTAIEEDPSGMPPHNPGAKLDAGKPLAGVIGDFGLALLAVAEIGTFGAKKYTRGGWQSVPDGITRYSDAMWRHLLKESQESHDPDSGLTHQAHAAWNALARLELALREIKK